MLVKGSTAMEGSSESGGIPSGDEGGSDVMTFGTAPSVRATL